MVCRRARAARLASTVRRGPCVAHRPNGQARPHETICGVHWLHARPRGRTMDALWPAWSPIGTVCWSATTSSRRCARPDGGVGRPRPARARRRRGRRRQDRGSCARSATAGAPARVLWGACDALFTPRPLGPFLDAAAERRRRWPRRCGSGAGPHEVAAALLRGRAAPAGRRSSCSRTCTGPTRRRSTWCACSPGASAAAGARHRDLPRRRARARPTRCASCWASSPRAARSSDSPCRRSRREAVGELAAPHGVDPADLHRADVAATRSS